MEVPPFWLPGGERGAEAIDPRVLDVAKENWVWAFRLVSRKLNDDSRTAGFIEKIAVQVSTRLRQNERVGQSLSGYYRTAVIRRLQTQILKERVISYGGTAQEIEAQHRPFAPDWVKIFHDRMALQALFPHMSPPVRRMLLLRFTSLEWEDIAELLGTSAKQARSRFYYGVARARQRLLREQARRRKGVADK